MIYPKFGSKNQRIYKKVDKKLKKRESKSSKCLSPLKLLKNPSFLLRVSILLIAVAGISGMVDAHPLNQNSTHTISQFDNSPNKTVYIESGFSGTVTIKDTMRNVITVTNVDYKPSSSGTGLIVTPNGHIITSFHVVSDPIAMDRYQKLKKIEDKNIKFYVEEEALKNYINKNPQLGYKLLKKRPKSIRKDLKSDKNMDYLTKVFIKNKWIYAGSYQYNIYVKGLALDKNHENPLKAHLVDVGNYKNDEDIALLKIDPKVKNLPVFTINSKDQKINEILRIYGYPGDKIQNLEDKIRLKNESIASSPIYIPSYVSGHLTSKNPNSQGIVYYKTNAVTLEGYSGGPVVDDKNRILGILVYGLYKEDKFKNSSKKRAEKGEGSLFLPSNYIVKICKRNKIPLQIV